MRTIAVIVTTLAAIVLNTPAADAGHKHHRHATVCPRVTFDTHLTCTVVHLPRR